MVFISGGQLCSPDLFKPVDTDKTEKCKPASCCPHRSFNVRGRGGPALWDGNLMHINTGLHLWGSEGKTLRPSYRGWKGCAWIESEVARARGRERAHAHAHAQSRIPHTRGWRLSQLELPCGMFLGPHLRRLWSRCRRMCWVKWGYTPGWKKIEIWKKKQRRKKISSNSAQYFITVLFFWSQSFMIFLMNWLKWKHLAVWIYWWL